MMKSSALTISTGRAHRPLFSSRLAVFSILSTVLALGCGNDGSDAVGGSNGDGATDGAGGGDGNVADVFVVMTAVENREGRTVFMNAVEDLKTRIDLTEAVETVAGRVRAAYGNVFTFDSETRTVTKWDISDDLSVTQAARFSMSNLGVSSFSDGNTFVSPTKAYYVAADIRQYVVWNPAVMAIVKTIPFGDDMPLNSSPGQGSGIVSGDGETLFVTMSNVNYSDLSTTLGMRVAVINLNTDKLVKVVADTRCPGGNFARMDPDGNIVFLGDGVMGFTTHFGVPPAKPACLLRIKPGETEFDPTWMIAGTTVAGDSVGDLGALQIVDDKFMALRRDEEAAPLADLEVPFQYFGRTRFVPVVGSTADFAGSLVETNGSDNFFGLTYVVDGDFYVSPVNIEDRGGDARAFAYRIRDNNTLELMVETVGSIMWIGRVR